jgi:LL-diaminopimelate aminotransferase
MRFESSKRIQDLGTYAFAEVDREVEKLRRRGIDPIDFGVGDPTVPTPAVVRESLKVACDVRATSGYPSYIGSTEYREAAAAWMKRRFSVDLDPATEITSTAGSKEAIFHAPLAWIDPGDRVLVPSPGYPPYERGTRFANGIAAPYALRPENGYLPDLDRLTPEVLRETRVLWINYPNSPSGVVAPLDLLEELVSRCRENDCILASDEAYSEIWFGDESPPSALQTGVEGVVAVFSLSKRSAMTGYRVGWVAGDDRAIAAYKKLKTNVDSGTPTFIQDAAIAALADEEHAHAFREEYRAKRAILCEALADAGLPDCRPEAALYVWQRIPEGMTSVEFATRLLDPEIAIVTTPGAWIGDEVDGLGNTGEGHVRFALVPTIEDTERAAERIRRLTI